MKHILNVSVSEKSSGCGIMQMHKIPVRERLLNKLFGAAGQIVVLVPGNTVQAVSITEVSGTAAETQMPVGCGTETERSRYEAVRS